MKRKKWQVMPIDKDAILEYAAELNIDPHAVLLAFTRGVADVPEIAEFFGAEPPEIADPFDFPDMERAVERINYALSHGEKIAVYGDYDVDGVSSTALLFSFLKSKKADVFPYVPDRHTQGYGLSFAAVDELKQRGAKLIITVDNGISAVEEAEYIRSLGMDIVITDHHLPGAELPKAAAVVDPHLPACPLSFRDYSGSGVAYKLACAVEGDEIDELLDLAALGTVADVMPLLGENRSIVKSGLKIMQWGTRPGINALREAAACADNLPTSTDLAFRLSPRLNAAGRMGSAQRSLRLLLCEDIEAANELAREIDSENSARQQAEQEILSAAVKRIEASRELKYAPVLVIDGEGWNDGVIGIVASRLTELYCRPSIVVSINGEKAKGSGRSIHGFSLYDALCEVENTLISFGGHTLAAGINLEPGRIDEFRKAINNYALSREMPFAVQRIDYRAKISSLNEDLLAVTQAMEPCGAGNPQPVFGLFNVKLERIIPVGSGRHLKLAFSRGNESFTALRFSCPPEDFPFIEGDMIDLAVNIKENDYAGKKSVSIIIKNMRFHSVNEDLLLPQLRFAENYLYSGEADEKEKRLLAPGRDLSAAVYRFLKANSPWRHGVESLCVRLGTEEFAKTAVLLEAFCEAGLVSIDGGVITTLPVKGKIDLSDTPILRTLNA